VNLLSSEKISKSYSEKVLLDQISLGINEGDKIGVIGINGTGKSTLLKLIAGVEYPDEGKIIHANDLRVEYLPQNPLFDENTTVLAQVFKCTSPLMQLLRNYEDARQKFEKTPTDVLLEKRLLSLTQEMENQQAWTVESDAKSILTKLGIFDFDAKVATLSGGQKKRVAMAAALINPADLLILDEPTNHIDNATVDWLEKLLNSRSGALLMVTHDRYFLDRVCNRIIELDRGRLFSYQANYSRFLQMKAERDDMEQASERKRQNLFRRELEWISRGAQARSTKQKYRVERFKELKDQKALSMNDKIEIQTVSTRLGKKTIELSHVGKGYDYKELIRDFSYIVLRDDRIGIVGPNGAGKSTLLKMIAGRLQPDTGFVETGETIKIGFFAQENDEMDDSLRVIEYIRDEAEYLTVNGGTVSASQMLEMFLFPPSAQWTPISKLSGGEKRRLYLLRILMSAPNILLLDEPTNDLDIHTLTILENYLDDFQGAVIAVSHDRYFLDRIAEKIFLLDGNGSVDRFEGNYSYYIDCLKNNQQNSAGTKSGGTSSKEANYKGANFGATASKGTNCERSATNNASTHSKQGTVKLSPTKSSQVKAPETKVPAQRTRPLRFSYKEQKEYEQIDGLIAELESKISELDTRIDAASADFECLQELLPEKKDLESRLEEAMDRWVYLNELAEKIDRSHS
jgi:ATP-binding cassette subfamily F protein uup